MMPRKSRLTAEAQGGFLAALRGGAMVEAAAASVGVAISTLYWRRKRDARFDSEWTAAAAASAGWVIERGKGEKARLVRSKRRLRFDRARREVFLGGVELSCHTREAAEAALVHRGTVWRHARRDPGFARDNEAALERGYARLERLAVEERAQAAERARRRGRIAAAPDARPPADFEAQMRLLEQWRRRDGRLGPRRVRRARLRTSSFEEAMGRLERRLRALGIKVVPSS
jgi:hypothetical protein